MPFGSSTPTVVEMISPGLAGQSTGTNVTVVTLAR